MAAQLPKRLSYEDAAFLALERDNTPMNVGSVGIYEGEIDFNEFQRHVERRIDLIPRYRHRLVPAPLHLVHPAWVEDPHFDIARHVRPVTLPAPGGRKELMEVAARFFAEPLPRDKPLWEMLLVDGLSGGWTAHVGKVHHCMVDGVAGVELLAAILDLEPKPPARERRGPRPQAKPLPGRQDLWFEAVADRWIEQTRTNAGIVASLLDPVGAARTAAGIVRAFGAAGGYLAAAAPATPWNHEISSPSRLAWQSLPFAEVRRVAKAGGTTINNVVLASIAGALERYMHEIGHPTDGVRLRAACPVNVRNSQSDSLGNRVSFMLVGLPIGMQDPAERLRLIHAEVEAMKQAKQAAGIDAFLRNLGKLPAYLQSLLVGGLTLPNSLSNLVCTNVPGPLRPLYLMEHRMAEHYPWVPLGWQMGLAVAIMSYDTRLWFGIVADRDVPGDLDRVGAHLAESFHELQAATAPPARPHDAAVPSELALPVIEDAEIARMT
jgi:WS/DGAT/MGAT family acyltransferase